MKTVLVVTQPFGDYAKGDHITGTDEELAQVRKSAHSHVVARAAAADEEIPAERAAPPVEAQEPAADEKPRAKKPRA